MTTRAEMFEELCRSLAGAGVQSPALDAWLILCQGGGFSFEEYLMDPKQTVSEAEVGVINRFKARRLAREPVSRIFARRDFWKHEFALNALTLDPRPDTESLVQAALDVVRLADFAAPKILDLGTGSGCILLSLLDELPHAVGVGVDCSFDALVVAQRNALRLGLEERSNFIVGDWASAFGNKKFDIVVSNPPYICSAEIPLLAPEVCRYDPVEALDGGPTGLNAYSRIAGQLVDAIVTDGWILFEVGDGQAEDVESMIEQEGIEVAGNDDGVRLYDLGGRQRVVAGRQRS